ncbi:MAG: flagellar basal body P-ring protein FlgI [Planctomycetaceae bacterium]|nr:flagellar basal body P-ring protein FlgI [Planctomycetaceae bacterium]
MKRRAFLSLLLCTPFCWSLMGCKNPLAPRGGNNFQAKPIPRNRLLADYATPGGSSWNYFVVDNISIVSELSGTGGVESDSRYRQVVRNSLQRDEIKNIDQWLDSPTTSIVHVKGKIPPGILKGETFDVEVTLPPGSETTSLRGGWLYKTSLSEMQDFHSGHTWAYVKGPLLLDPSDENKSRADNGKRATVLGKAVCMHDRDFTLTLDREGRNEGQLAQVASEIEQRINRRFKIPGEPTGVAKAKSQPSVSVDVKMHPDYRVAPNRYLAVLLSIRCFENETEQTKRLEELKNELLDPSTSLLAALQLEALSGKAGAESLNEGLKSPNENIRFYSAEALAYMSKPGVGEILADITRQNLEKRASAILALTAMGSNQEAMESLVPLLAEDDPSLRYSAFWAIWRRDPEHPSIRGEQLGKDQVNYHVLNTRQPMVHVLKSRRNEIVLFSQNIALNGPFVGNAGPQIMVDVAAPNQVKVVRVNPGGINSTRIIPNSLDTILRAIAELSGSYQDMLDFLGETNTQQPNGQRALTCQYVIDADVQGKERSYSSGMYADQEDDTKTIAPPKKKSVFERINPVTWFASEDP